MTSIVSEDLLARDRQTHTHTHTHTHGPYFCVVYLEPFQSRKRLSKQKEKTRKKKEKNMLSHTQHDKGMQAVLGPIRPRVARFCWLLAKNWPRRMSVFLPTNQTHFQFLISFFFLGGYFIVPKFVPNFPQYVAFNKETSEQTDIKHEREKKKTNNLSWMSLLNIALK